MYSRPIHGGHRQWAATQAGCLPEQILDFSTNVNPLGPPESIQMALGQALSDPLNLAVASYPDPEASQLRQALAEFYHLNPGWLLIGNGAAELMTWAARDCQDWGSALMLSPAFADYGRALRAMEVEIQLMDLPLFEPVSLSRLIEQAEDTGRLPAVLWLNNPHNPTGRLWQRDELLRWLPRFQLVVVDEAFMDFLPAQADPGHPCEQSLLSWVAEFPQLVVLRSLTKFFTIPGLRLGFAVGHPERLARWQTWRDPWPVNNLAGVAALAGIGDHDFQRRTLEWLPAARQHLFQGLQQLPGLTPLESTVNFLLVHSQGSALDLQTQLLRQHRILIRDCLSFPELGESFFRVSVRTISEQEQLLAACQSILSQTAQAYEPLRR